jgi:hypothetical protein
LVSALNRVDLPTLGSPTIPIDRLTTAESNGLSVTFPNQRARLVPSLPRDRSHVVPLS